MRSLIAFPAKDTIPKQIFLYSANVSANVRLHNKLIVATSQGGVDSRIVKSVPTSPIDAS